jgi:hypothetical protein
MLTFKASKTLRTSSPATDPPIESVSLFLARIEKTKEAEVKAGNKSDFIFRGQSTDEPLIPRIARLKPKGKLPKIESLMLAEFERLSLPFIQFEPQNQWDLLAIAQHHGLPTRLLDWSFSALAALWFCVQKPPKNDKTDKPLDGVVWLLKTLPEDFIEFPTNETPFSQGRTRIFRPRAASPRILAQTGVFTCHLRTAAGSFVPLELNKAYKARLLKISIPARSFGGIRDQLVASGVSIGRQTDPYCIGARGRST